jgi:hypothetical protein
MYALRGALAERAEDLGYVSDHFQQNHLPFGFETEQLQADEVRHERWRGHAGTLLPSRVILPG